MKGKVQAAPLILIGIVAIIALYSYALPIADKCMLYPSLDGCGDEEVVIFFESKDLLEPSETAARYWFKDVQLFRRDSLDIATVFDKVSTKQGWFISSSAKTSFKIQEGGKDVKLFIVVNDAFGGLKIKVNGKKITKVRGEGVHVVSLPLKILEDENTLELKSAIPLLPFYITKHDIGKVSLREEYTITQNRVSREIPLEYNLDVVQQAVLRFDTNCFTEEELTVFVNEEKIFDGRICNGFQKDIIDFLEDDNNTITFATEGNYYIEDIKIDIGVKQRTWPTYYFDVPQSKLDEGIILMKLKFPNVGEKKLTIYLNGEALSIDTMKTDFETAINKYLVEGQNSIILIPETEFVLESIILQ